jgi:hypothetical protein
MSSRLTECDEISVILSISLNCVSAQYFADNCPYAIDIVNPGSVNELLFFLLILIVIFAIVDSIDVKNYGKPLPGGENPTPTDEFAPLEGARQLVACWHCRPTYGKETGVFTAILLTTDA